MRADVSGRIAERKKSLLSLTSNRLTLEQIFLKLTQAPNNQEARKMLGLDANPTSEVVELENLVIGIPDEQSDKEDNE